VTGVQTCALPISSGPRALPVRQNRGAPDAGSTARAPESDRVSQLSGSRQAAMGELVDQGVDLPDDRISTARIVRQDFRQIVPFQVPSPAVDHLRDLLIE